MQRAKSELFHSTRAQEVLRQEIEKNKRVKKSISKIEKESRRDEKFLQKQDKKKQKKRGH